MVQYIVMKTVIYLVRHGEVHNPEGIFYERLPGFHLSDLGVAQVHELGKFLSDKGVSAIYASPLERTRQTADIIASYQRGVAVTHDKRLLEVSSMIRGQKQVDLALERWNFYKLKYTKLGGEKLSDIWKRIGSFFKETVRKHKGQAIVVVSHGDPIMISMVKHKGKRLSVHEIRGVEYVQTAKGFQFIFEEFTAVEVNTLNF